MFGCVYYLDVIFLGNGCAEWMRVRVCYLDVRYIGCKNILLKEFEELGRGLFLKKEGYLKEGFLGKRVFCERSILWKEDLEGGLSWDCGKLCGNYVDGVIWERVNRGNRGKRNVRKR